MSLPFPISDVAKEEVHIERLLAAYGLFSWLVIYTVKFCFLTFFRVLIDRVRRMILYWRVIVLITIVFCGLSLSEPFIACPPTDVSPSECLKGAALKRTLIVGVTAICLDVNRCLAFVDSRPARNPVLIYCSHYNPNQPSLECPHQTSPEARHRRISMLESRHDRYCHHQHFSRPPLRRLR